MRCMVDTNVLVSAALFPKGTCAAAYMRAVLPPFQPLVCTYILEELRRVFFEKFPARTEAYLRFAEALTLSVEVCETPTAPTAEESCLGDVADRPILRAALLAGAEFLLTGDKGFAAAGLQKPRVVSAAAFLALRV